MSIIIRSKLIKSIGNFFILLYIFVQSIRLKIKDTEWKYKIEIKRNTRDARERVTQKYLNRFESSHKIS